jgi:MFS family permease
LLVTITSLLVPLVDGRIAITLLQGLSAVAAAVFPPAIAAITLGIFKPRAFAERMGRNEAFNHAGNATAAALAAALAYGFGPIVVFWLMAAMAVGTIVSTLAIPAAAIDNRVARGLAPEKSDGDDKIAGWKTVLADRNLRVFAIAMVAFHFANAAMLPLAGQKLALLNPTLATSLMAACIVAAQIIMVPVAYLTGKKCDVWGRKPIFLAAFAVLAVRGALYPLSDSPYWIVGVQLLDGVGAGIFGALFPVVVADVTRGQGHFNAALGGIAAAAGLGGALSTLFAGFIVVTAGYSAAFLSLAAIAAAGFAIYLIAMPETAQKRVAEPPGPATPLPQPSA